MASSHSALRLQCSRYHTSPFAPLLVLYPPPWYALVDGPTAAVPVDADVDALVDESRYLMLLLPLVLLAPSLSRL